MEACRLELGAGGGLVSLAVARGCQDIKHRILVTDQEEMFSLMEHNVRLNGVEDRAKAMVLNWYVFFLFSFFFFPGLHIISRPLHFCPSPSSSPPPCVHFLFPPDAVTPELCSGWLLLATFSPHHSSCFSPPDNDGVPAVSAPRRKWAMKHGMDGLGWLADKTGQHGGGGVALSLPPPSGLPIRGDELPQEVVESRPNVILAADCVYFEPAFPLLQKTMADLLALCPEDATIYFCFKKRRRADMQFLKKAQKLFSVVEVADQARPVFSREGLFLYAISSKQRQQ